MAPMLQKHFCYQIRSIAIFIFWFIHRKLYFLHHCWLQYPMYGSWGYGTNYKSGFGYYTCAHGYVHLKNCLANIGLLPSTWRCRTVSRIDRSTIEKTLKGCLLLSKTKRKIWKNEESSSKLATGNENRRKQSTKTSLNCCIVSNCQWIKRC